MSSSRVRPQAPQAQAASASSPPYEGIEMEKMHHEEVGLGVPDETPSPPTSSSRQAWSRDNPGFEPEEGMMEADWPPASPAGGLCPRRPAAAISARINRGRIQLHQHKNTAAVGRGYWRKWEVKLLLGFFWLCFTTLKCPHKYVTLDHKPAVIM